MDGSNHLFVSNYVNKVGEYDATTGATINENFVTGLQDINGLAFITPVPEPSSLLLLAAAVGIVGGMRRRRRGVVAGSAGVLVTLGVALVPGPAQARQVLLVGTTGPAPVQSARMTPSPVRRSKSHFSLHPPSLLMRW